MTAFWLLVGFLLGEVLETIKHIRETHMESIKGALWSKTVWFNIVTGAMELANAFGGFLPPGVGMAINVIGNVILRFVTTEPLKDKVKK